MQEITVGIMGMGTVGSGVMRILNDNSELLTTRSGLKFKVKRVLVRDKTKSRDFAVDGELFTINPDELLNDPDIDILIELMGGLNPAYEYIRRALRSGKHVVTANKEVIAKKAGELLALSREQGVELLYEGSVGGGIPLLRPLKECLVANNIDSIVGIINGTTNYMLSRMTREGLSFAEALSSAQKLGYAEADPASDIDGYDAAYKIAILASLAFGQAVLPDDVLVDGIRTVEASDIRYAAELGYEIKLLAMARKLGEQVEVRVHPTLIPATHPLARVSHVYNAVFVRGREVGELMFSGRGAGSLPTASAVVADLLNAAAALKGKNSYVYNPYRNRAYVVARPEIKSRYYVRLIGVDRPGVFAQVAAALAEEDVSMASIIQRNGLEPKNGRKLAEMVVVTYPVNQGSVDRALETIKNLADIEQVASVIPVEKDL